MGEFFFIGFLFIFGLLFGLLFQSKQSLAFLLFSAIYWGSLNWVVCSVLMVILIGHIEIAWLLVFYCIEILSFIIYGIISKRFVISKKSLLFIFIYSFIFIGFDYLFYKINLSVVTPDSLFMLKMSSVIIDTGFKNLTWSSPASIGYFISMMHTPSKFFGVDYLTNLQSMYSINFLFLFFIMIFDLLKENHNRLLKVLISMIFAVFLFSSTMMQFQFAYVHTNFLTGVFLSILIYCYSKFLIDKNESWLFFGGLAGLAFSLIRTENPITILIFITIFIGISKINYQLRIKYFASLILVILFFESVLIFVDSPYLHEMVNQKIIFGFVGLLFLYTLFILFSRWKIIEKWILPRLHYLFFGLVLLVLILLTIIFPSQILVSIVTIYKSLIQYGGWDLTWILLIPITLWFCYLELKNSKFVNVTFVKLVLPIYMIAILLMGFVDGHPYLTPRWSSSPNRMFVQVLPMVLLLLSMTLAGNCSNHLDQKQFEDNNQ